MSIIKVDSVEEAVRAAQQLMRPKNTYWFRGQAQNWPVRSSMARVKPEDRQLAQEKIARYKEWVKHTPGLGNLALNTNAAIAVAQHYGLPTNFIDFTTQPQIAGFFASEKAVPGTAGNLACIICLDVEALREFWQPLAKWYDQPEFLKIELPDLWRLEAQDGCFLFCPNYDIEHIYDFDRILFPNTHVFPQIKREDAYPERKSHLEIVLDQYFMNEQMLEGRRVWKLLGVKIHLVETPKEGCCPDVFPNGLPGHESWAAVLLQPWLELPPEPLHSAQTATNFRIRVQDLQDTAGMARAIAGQVLNDLLPLPGIRGKLVSWSVEVMGNHLLPQDFSFRLAPRLARLWDGLRRLPFSDEDLCAGLGMCVGIAIALGGDFSTPDSRHWELAAKHCLPDPIELEFGAADGSYSRGYVSAARLAATIRSDLLSHVSDTWKGQMAENPLGILQASWMTKKTYDFRLLTPLFATEVAPYQVLARDSAIFYSPARLVSLGLP